MSEQQKIIYIKELRNDIYDIIEIIYASKSYKKDMKEQAENIFGDIPEDTKDAISHLRVLVKMLLHEEESRRREGLFFKKIFDRKRKKGEDFLQSD